MIKAGTFFKAISDNVGLTDILTTTVLKIITILDNVGITDGVSKIGSFKRTITDGINISDVLSKIGSFIYSQASIRTFQICPDCPRQNKVSTGFSHLPMCSMLIMGDTDSPPNCLISE